MIALRIFGLSAAACFLATFSLARDLLHKKRARPRLIVSPGVVREMKTNTWMTKTGGTRGYTHVSVEFVVQGNRHVSHTLRLFAGNHQYAEVGKLYDFPAGQEVGSTTTPPIPGSTR